MSTFYVYESLSSTMDEGRIQVLKGVEEGAVIVASRQTQGRGRRGRQWESPLGNLFMTYITYLNCPLSQAPQLSFVACVSVGEFLRPLLPPGNSLTYKWPNDLLLNKKKVGGLLLEAIPLSHKPEIAYLVGCGLNLKEHPLEPRYPATSFQEEGIYLNYDEVLKGITSSLAHFIALWQQNGFAPIQTLWMKGCAHLQEKIRFDIQEKIYEGIFEGLDEEGLLILNNTQGTIKLAAGEILAQNSRHCL